MTNLTQWSWTTLGLGGVLGMMESLVEEQVPTSDYWFAELEKCKSRLDQLISRLAARPEIAQSAHRQPPPDYQQITESAFRETSDSESPE